MAKILFAAGIEEVSGALSKVNRKSMHVDDQNMFLATHRKAETMSKTCQRAYYRKSPQIAWGQNPLVSVETTKRREIFVNRRKAVASRRKDLSKISMDLTSFLAYKKDHPNTTFMWFYWAGAKKYGNEESGSVTWPTDGPIVLD